VTIAKTLSNWRGDTNLAAIRDELALAKFPEPERAALRALWADVEALRTKAEDKSKAARAK
jgi:hypothetical protein